MLTWFLDTPYMKEMMMKFLPPLVFMPFALYPAGLLFHVVVFITKSNILLCRHCHLSPPACDFPCMCVCRPMHNESLGPSDGVMTRRLTDTKAHVQKSSCFIVCGRTELCFLHGSSKQQRLKCGETGGWGVGAVKEKWNLDMGFTSVSALPCADGVFRPGRPDWHTLSDTSMWMYSYTHCL